MALTSAAVTARGRFLNMVFLDMAPWNGKRRLRGHETGVFRIVSDHLLPTRHCNPALGRRSPLHETP
jgi:hypothetical protein